MKLPNKPSEILAIALVDYRKVIKQKNKYKIQMSIWYNRQDMYDPYDFFTKKELKERKKNPKCEVCLAGCVIAKRASPSKLKRSTLNPDDFDKDTREKLEFINNIREGDFDLTDYFYWKNAPHNLLEEDELINLQKEIRSINDYIEKHYNDDLGKAPLRIYDSVVKKLQKLGL